MWIIPSHIICVQCRFRLLWSISLFVANERLSTMFFINGNREKKIDAKHYFCNPNNDLYNFNKFVVLPTLILLAFTLLKVYIN